VPDVLELGRSLRRRWSVPKLVLATGLVAAAVAIAVVCGRTEQVGGDFHVFWQAGRNFATGAPLYHGELPGARKFIYPPFAAMVFQLFAVMPLQAAAEVFSFVNIVLIGVSIGLTRKVVGRLQPDRPQGWLPLAVATALSLQFFFDNIHHVQVNEVIFVLLLLGLDAHLRGQSVRSAAYFVVATAVKITPAFFVLWLLVRGPRRAALAVPAVALACIATPLLARGAATGAGDLAEYYGSFLAPYQHGQVMTDPRNQSLGAVVYRMMQPTENEEHASYEYLPASPTLAALTYKAGAAALLLLFLAKVAWLRGTRATVTAIEVSGVFLISHLLSPITWRAHLVTLLFVFYSFLLARPSVLSPPQRIGLAVLYALIAVSSIGRDLLPDTVYNHLAGYGIVAWTMLALFIASLTMTPATLRNSLATDR